MSIFRRSEFINTSDFSKALPSRPGHTPADKMRVAMHTQGQAPLPIKEGRAKGGVTCPKCGHSHAAGSTCAYMKGLQDWLDKANFGPDRYKYGADNPKRGDNGTFAPKGGSKDISSPGKAPKNQDEDKFWKEAQSEFGGGSSSARPKTVPLHESADHTKNESSAAFDQTKVNPDYLTSEEETPSSLMSPGLMQQALEEDKRSRALVPYKPQQQSMASQGPIIDAQFEDVAPESNPSYMLPGHSIAPQPASSMPPQGQQQMGASQPQLQLGSGYNPMQASSTQGAAASAAPPASGAPSEPNKPNKPQSTPTPARQGNLDIAGLLPGNARAIGAGLGQAGGTIGATASAVSHPFGALSQEAHGLLKPQKPGSDKKNNNGAANTAAAQTAQNTHANTMANYGQKTRKPMPAPVAAPSAGGSPFVGAKPNMAGAQTARGQTHKP